MASIPKRKRLMLAVIGTGLLMVWLLVPLARSTPAAEPKAKSPAVKSPDLKSLEPAFARDVQPLLKRYCFECHSGKVIEADLDLATFGEFSHVRKHPKVWQKIGEMLESEQMPPKDAKQLAAEERIKLKQWVHDLLVIEAAANAGDPGPVVLRRLNNVEYTWTLRDLTGVPSLNPAKEFPADSGAGEGFTNVGNALVMSPPLLMKYLDSAKEVAEHAVLLPDGLRFSANKTRRDWTNESLARIREFYHRYSSTDGGSLVNLQGVKFDTNRGGRLPVESYLAATLQEREALQAGKKTIAEVARERGLNAKYLDLLWLALNAKANESGETGPLETLRSSWRAAKPTDAPLLAKFVAKWQSVLWKFNSVGQTDRAGKGKAWMESSFGSAAIAAQGSHANKGLEAALDEFRQLFPLALCYTQIVPVDEVVTLTLFFREDHHLRRLMLNDEEAKQLDRYWDELLFIAHEPIELVTVIDQLYEFATQDRPDLLPGLKALKEPIRTRAAAFRQRLIDCEPKQLDALVDFAAQAYRRPLRAEESKQLRELYANLRKQELPHEEAFRLTLARVLVSPAFLYRLEEAGPGAKASPVSDWELASRLSYFLWSSQPDAELRKLAETGKLSDPKVLAAQTKRMLADPKARRLATEFACQWLHIADFDQLNEKSERHFPTFASLRGAMHEESILFLTDLFQNDRPLLNILDADYTFLNDALAGHYNIPGVCGPQWRRVEGVGKFGRGGILAQASTLAKQSGASRTSPILRGNWVSEVLLGERLPRPPKDVPQLADTVPAGLTERQLIEKHSSDASCKKCHVRIDPFGFALENYDAIGRFRDKSGDLAIDTKSTLPDGAKLEGLSGLRDYLSKTRRGAFIRQFNRKLLGYALGRSVQLSDEPLLTEIQTKLASSDHRVGSVVEMIVLSPQFRQIRGAKSEQE